MTAEMRFLRKKRKERTRNERDRENVKIIALEDKFISK
jgi:hypothetical protein